MPMQHRQQHHLGNLELQLQQIAALNISDVFSVVIPVTVVAAAVSDYLMHLHI